jgi:hypothetical protein
MKSELKIVVDQLTEALGIKDDRKVAALFDDQNNNEFIGWCIVRYKEDGEIIPMLGTKCQTIKELFEKFYNQ